MTFKVDNDALKVAMMRHYEEKLAKELREMFVYSSNPDTTRIWQLYLEEVERQNKRQQEHIKNTGEWAIIIIGFGMMGYGIKMLFT